MKKIKDIYIKTLEKYCLKNANLDSNSVEYWQNKLFFEVVKFIIPLSMLALIPGVWYCLKINLISLALIDIILFSMLLITAFAGFINIKIRKQLLIWTSIITGFILLWYVGISGPGLIYLFAACIFGFLIIEKKYSIYIPYIVLIICIIYGFIIEFDWNPRDQINKIQLAEWIAISSNLVFLSLLASKMIPNIFEGLGKTLLNQKKLQKDLEIKTDRLEKANSELKNKNENLEQFAYVASHDLQEPLRMIHSFMELLEQKYGPKLDDKARKYIDFAVKGSKRMREIIIELLNFSKADEFTEERTKIDLNLLLNEILILHQKKIEEKDAFISVQYLPDISFYKTPLHLIFNNLISNALKYGKKNYPLKITIKYKNENNFHCFEIEDNGIGIPDDQKEKIFNMFQRFAFENEPNGTGMGLAIVKKIVNKLNGEISVSSLEGVGTTFTVKLPILIN